MKRYKTLLFDVDDTLLDFHAAQDQALDQLFTSVDIEPTATVKHAYATYNQGLWEKLERNEITRDELMATRFPTFFKEHFGKELLTVFSQWSSSTSWGTGIVGRSSCA